MSLLLAASINFRENNGDQNLHMEFALCMAKASHLDKETALSSITDCIPSKLEKQDTKESDCQTKSYCPSKFPAS